MHPPALHRTRARLARSALAALLLAAAACAAPVYTDHDVEADFTGLETFAWLDPPLQDGPREEGGAGSPDPFTHNTLLDKRLREAVETGLVARGYRKAGEDEAADFFVRYDVVSRQVLRDSPAYVGAGYGYPYHGYGYGGGVVYSGTRSYEEGTILLDVIDPASRTLAWRGWSSSRTRDGHIDARRVASTVDAILAKFPPEPPPPPETAPPAED